MQHLLHDHMFFVPNSFAFGNSKHLPAWLAKAILACAHSEHGHLAAFAVSSGSTFL
jgi:hypothetical protein